MARTGVQSHQQQVNYYKGDFTRHSKASSSPYVIAICPHSNNRPRNGTTVCRLGERNDQAAEDDAAKAVVVEEGNNPRGMAGEVAGAAKVDVSEVAAEMASEKLERADKKEVLIPNNKCAVGLVGFLVKNIELVEVWWGEYTGRIQNTELVEVWLGE